jgi:hypothetical protein
MLLCRGDWLCPRLLTAKPPVTEERRGQCERYSTQEVTEIIRMGLCVLCNHLMDVGKKGEYGEYVGHRVLHDS